MAFKRAKNPTKKQDDLVERLRQIKNAAALAMRIAQTAHIVMSDEDKTLMANALSEMHHEANIVYEKYDEGEYTFI